MALGIKCDRCKKFMDMSNENTTYRSSNVKLKYYTLLCDCSYKAYNRTFHLCDSCYEIFMNEFLNNESEED